MRLGPPPETTESLFRSVEKIVQNLLQEQKMSVRAKFRLSGYKTYIQQGQELRTLEFYPVTDGSEENKKFFAWTPSGKLELGLLNPEAWKQFELDKEYYLDFTPVE